jgi:alpha-galactosidase/6-phospho-beta-glucosidase family protein
MQAFLHDPLLMARLDLDQTRDLFREMMDANRDFLPQFAGGGVRDLAR